MMEENYHRKCKRAVNIILKSTLLSLETKENQPSELKNYLRFSKLSELSLLKDRAKETIGLLLRCSVLLYTVYYLSKKFLNLILHSRRDLLLTSWRPMARFNSSNCNSFLDLIFLREEDRERYNEINHLNQLIGKFTDRLTTLTRGLPVHDSSTHLLVMFCCVYYTIYTCMTQNIRVDLLSFLMNPQEERSRVAKEIELIFNDLLNNLRHTTVCNLFRFELDETMVRLYGQMRGKDVSTRNLGEDHREASQFEKIYIRFNTEILLKLKSANSVKPANLTDSWLRILNINFGFCLVIAYLSMIIMANLYYIFWIFAELVARVRQRLQQFDCANSSGHFLPGYFDFSIVKLNAEQQKIYRDYYNNRTSYIELLWIESNIYFDISVIKNIILNELIVYLNVVSASFFYTLHAFSHIDRIMWLNQVQNQIKDCTRELAKFSYHDQNEAFEEGPNRKLLERTTIAYVNWELFRRGQLKFKGLATLLAFQGTIMCSMTLVAVYLIDSKLDLDHKSVSLMLATYVVLLANVHLIFGAVLTSKILKIRISILKLLASCSKGPLQGNFIINLWLRQIASPSETLELYCGHFLGIYFSWGRLLTSNVYLVGLYLALLR